MLNAKIKGNYYKVPRQLISKMELLYTQHVNISCHKNSNRKMLMPQREFMLQYSAIKKASRIEYFTTAVVNNLLYYLDTQPILTRNNNGYYCIISMSVLAVYPSNTDLSSSGKHFL